MKNFRKVFTNLSLLALSVLAGLILCEVLAALIRPSPSVTSDILGRGVTASPRLESVRQDGISTWDLSPGQEGATRSIGSHDYEWRVNSLSLRGEYLPEEKRPGEVYILVLGDSQTFGTGIDQDDTFCSLLEEELEERTGSDVTVLNAGVPGYGTFDAMLKMQRLAGSVDIDLVLVVLFASNHLLAPYGNDVHQNYDRLVTEEHELESSIRSAFGDTELKSAPLASFLERHSHLYHLVTSVLDRLRGTRSYIDAARAYPRDFPSLRSAWRITRTLLKEIEDKAGAIYGADTVVVYMPDLVDLVLDDRGAETETIKNGIPCISLFDPLKEAMRGDPWRLRTRSDMHYNTFAHGVIAEKLAGSLREHPLFTKKGSPAVPPREPPNSPRR